MPDGVVSNAYAQLRSSSGPYVDWLGLSIDWEFRLEPALPVYMQISRDGLVLHLSQHNDDNPGGVMCHVEVDDLDVLIEEWRSRSADFNQKVQIMPWNARHISLRDPFDNTLGTNQFKTQQIVA